MRIAYFDCSSGISGDMCLGALVDAGAPLASIKKGLLKIPLRGYRLTEKKVRRSGLAATKIYVAVTNPKAETGLSRWKDVKGLIASSTLDPETKDAGLGVFKAIFFAEAVAHGGLYDRVHLHEIGYIDTIVDIFGTLIGLKALGVEGVFFSPINMGGGTVKTAHGVLPVPAPATAELLKGVPVYSSPVPYELTTPTGAALVKALCRGIGTRGVGTPSCRAGMPVMSIEKIGVGAGDRETEGSPNVLRIFLGEAAGEPSIYGEEVSVIEANMDDMNPQIYGYLVDVLFKEGALDVFLTQVIMKKGRPGVKLTVLSQGEKKQAMIDTILKETTTIGLRSYNADRVTLQRETYKADTAYGKIRIKRAGSGQYLKEAPEYEDCKKAAIKHKKPLIEVIERVKKGLSSLA